MNNIDFKKLGDYVKIKTGKLDANASSEDGEYPFFTCSIEPLKISSYSYDCECCLVAGNGDLNVKYYNGKFDAYQRTYIIESLDKEKLDVMYLYFFLSSYIEVLRKQSIGGVIKYIKLGNLTDALIPIPELSKQKEICQNLIKAKKILSSNENLLSKYDTLIKSEFVEMFGEIDISPQRNDWTELKDITTIYTGTTPSTTDEENWNGDILWITPAEMTSESFYIYDTERKITEKGQKSKSLSLMPANTVLLSTRAPIGKVGIAGSPMTCNQGFKNFYFKEDVLNPVYLYFLFKSNTEYLNSKGTGTTFKELSKSAAEKIKVPIPDFDLQNKFAAFAQQIDKSKSEMAIYEKVGFNYGKWYFIMANFDYLLQYKEFSAFSGLANEAEKQYNKSTMFCGISARKCVEQAVNWMYSVDDDLYMPYDDSLQVLISDKNFVKIVPGDILNCIHIVRKTGNDAVHSRTELSKSRALLSLKALFNFLNWIVFTYSSTYESRTFDETLIPANKATIIVKKNQEEIDKYRSELDEKEQSIADLKKQLADLQKALTSNKSKPKDDTKINYETIDEKTTRKLFIDEDLKKLGWQFDGVMVQEEYTVHDMGDKHSDGFVDYVLFGKDHKPLAVVEAKKTSKDPNIGKQQAKDYADCLEREYGQRPFIFYTNGFDCNFWDDLQAAPRRVSMVFSQGDLQKLIDRRSLKEDINSIQINKEITGRDYQMAAIKAVVKSANEGFRKFLLVMATGTGKTRTVISLTDVFARANYATNILFLTDRIQLVKQAYSNYKEHLKSMSLCNMLDYQSRQIDKNARIVF